MQNAAFRAVGLDWTYELLDVAPEDLTAAIRRLREDDCGGANVTIPHKQAVMEHLDLIDEVAMRCRAVNAIVNDAGRLGGYNTDVAGVRHALDGLGMDPQGANAVILGAGGAARAAAQALQGAHLTFVTRHPEDADVPGRTFGWNDPGVVSLTRAAEVLVNATPLGRREEMPLRPGALPRQGVVIDLVYVTGGTPLVRKARSLGLRAADGWEVLLWQGASAFQLWTKMSAPLEAMRETLRP
jgi:shikimate dehydrogenase